MNLSLDDYIVQNRNSRISNKGRGGNTRARQQGRGNVLNRTGITNQNKKFTNRAGGFNSGRLNSGRLNSGRLNSGRINTGRVDKVKLSGRITDARQKIIQNNRQKLTDAREKLGELAKQTDARLKLEKLKASRQAGRTHLPLGNQRLPGRRNNVQVPLQRTIRQSVGTVVVPNNWYQPSVDDMDVDVDLDLPGVSHVLRRTIPNEHATSRQLQPLNHQTRSSTHSSWPTSQHRLQKEVQTVSRGHIEVDYSSKERVRGKPQANVSLTNRWGGSQQTLLSPNSRNVPAHRMSGYRVVISNLHPSVIHEDIEELFEDVGPLVESRLLRPGTAEVVFEHLKDAEKAVESYHNRQLDKQPMKCVLMNGWQTRSMTPPSHSASLAMASGRAGVKKTGSGIKSAVVPDISTIHKALFRS